MKIAWWPHTKDPAVASYRLRCRQIVETLHARGHDVGIFQPGQQTKSLVLSKRYDPRSMALAGELRAKHHTRLILDLCDNHFYSQSQSGFWEERAENLRQAVSSVDLVIAASSALANVIQMETGRKDVVVIGDTVEQPHFPPLSARFTSPPSELGLAMLHMIMTRWGTAPGRRLVWFGSQGSPNAEGGMSDLLRIRPLLESLHRDRPLSLTVVSNNKTQYKRIIAPWNVPTHYVSWHPKTFSSVLTMHDVALIPITPNPFTRCKTGNRVLTALAHGTCVIADRIPSYEQLSDCIVLDRWNEGLDRLMADAAYREKLLEAGRKQLQETYSAGHIASQWEQVLRLD